MKPTLCVFGGCEFSAEGCCIFLPSRNTAMPEQQLMASTACSPRATVSSSSLPTHASCRWPFRLCYGTGRRIHSHCRHNRTCANPSADTDSGSYTTRGATFKIHQLRVRALTLWALCRYVIVQEISIAARGSSALWVLCWKPAGRNHPTSMYRMVAFEALG